MMRERQRGSVAVEYGIILPVFLMLVLGLIDTGRLLWTQTTLDRAAEAAARCGAIDAAACGTGTQLQQYAAGQALGLAIEPGAFSVAVQSCGVEVTAQYPFTLLVPWIARDELTLTAKACYPA